MHDRELGTPPLQIACLAFDCCGPRKRARSSDGRSLNAPQTACASSITIVADACRPLRRRQSRRGGTTIRRASTVVDGHERQRTAWQVRTFISLPPAQIPSEELLCPRPGIQEVSRTRDDMRFSPVHGHFHRHTPPTEDRIDPFHRT